MGYVRVHACLCTWTLEEAWRVPIHCLVFFVFLVFFWGGRLLTCAIPIPLVDAKVFRYNLTCTDTVYYQKLLTEAAVAAAVEVGMEVAAAAAEEEKSVASPANAAAVPASVVPKALAVTVNMELFSRRSTVPQSTITGDPVEHMQRQCCYAAHNLTIGPSWEITDWYNANFAEWSPWK